MSSGNVHEIFSTAEELALLVEAVQDYAIFLLGTSGEVRSWNRGAQRIMGYDAPEIVGRNFSTFYGPEDLANAKPRHELETAAREGRIEDEGWRIRKDGTRFWANTIITALRNREGQLTGFAKVTRDLTERKRADERLRRSEEMFRLLINSVKEYAIFMLDATGHIATWNLGAERIKGYQPDEIIGKHFSIFYPPEDLAWDKPGYELKEATRVGWFEDEGWRLRKDGSRFWANVVITAIFDEQHVLRGFTKVTRDMTERRQAEETQRALLEQREARLQAEDERRRAEGAYHIAQEANRAKDEFLMTLSHELRTPMTAILGWARILPTLPAADPMFRDAIAAIGRSAELQARLIDDVLDVSRILSGKLRLNVERIDVARIVEQSIDSVRPSADAKKIAIVADVAPDVGIIVADPTRVQQVLWNLLSNSVKFTPKGGRIRVSAARINSQLQMSVSDSGEGIDPEFLPHIFEAFRQAESPRTRIHGGLGLGLSIVRYIVEAHGGTISAASAGRNQGATFTVVLPISSVAPPIDAPEAPSEYAPIQRIDPKKLENRTILIVDDDRGAREVVTAVLQQAGAHTTTVESAPAALQAIAKAKPDIVITDIGMPEMDGYALLREIERRWGPAAMKVVALTAFPPTTKPEERRGFAAYMTKPVDPFALVDTIAAL